MLFPQTDLVDINVNEEVLSAVSPRLLQNDTARRCGDRDLGQWRKNRRYNRFVEQLLPPARYSQAGDAGNAMKDKIN